MTNNIDPNSAFNLFSPLNSLKSMTLLREDGIDPGSRT